ncbi:ankyrin [Thozetella sp. PMI_491]|nr:ankyrin [Thozetella sp. PMI_491]
MSNSEANESPLSSDDEEYLYYLNYESGNQEAAMQNEVTPLHLAAMYGHDDLVEFLLDSGADIDAIAEEFWDYRRPLNRLDHGQVLPKCTVQLTPLYVAISHMRASTSKLLVSRGASLVIERGENVTALQLAAFYGLYEIFNALQVNYGADLDLGGIADNTDNPPPLYYAAQCSNMTAIKNTLLGLTKMGADPNSRISIRFLRGITALSPLAYAVLIGNFTAALALLDVGAKPETDPRIHPNDLDHSLLYFLAQNSVPLANPELEKTLASARSNALTRLLISALMKAGMDINRVCSMIDGGSPNRTPLMLAVAHYAMPMVRHLIDLGADVDTQADDGCSALFNAICMAPRTDFVKVLLEAGANPNLIIGTRGTLLLHATWIGSQECVEALLDHGADVDAEDLVGDTSFFIAASHAHLGIMKVLLAGGANILHVNKQDETVLHKALKSSGIAALLYRPEYQSKRR